MLTVSKATSFLRVLLIPAFLWLYLKAQRHTAAAAVIAVSLLIEIAALWVEHEYKKPSKGERIFADVADKLTQCALIVCLAGSFSFWWTLPILFVAKEILHILDCRK